MKQFSEFLPIAVFAAVYYYTKDVFLSTGVLMAGVTLQVIYEFITVRSVSKRSQFILASVVILGGLTLVFRDEAFIQWKPTIVNWVFAGVLLGAMFFTDNNLLKKMLGKELKLPEHAWRNLTLGWSFGFILSGLLNLFVAFQFSMDVWVSYKLFGGFGITIVYMIITVAYLVSAGHLKSEALEETGAPDNKQD